MPPHSGVTITSNVFSSLPNDDTQSNCSSIGVNVTKADDNRHNFSIRHLLILTWKDDGFPITELE